MFSGQRYFTGLRMLLLLLVALAGFAYVSTEASLEKGDAPVAALVQAPSVVLDVSATIVSAEHYLGLDGRRDRRLHSAGRGEPWERPRLHGFRFRAHQGDGVSAPDLSEHFDLLSGGRHPGPARDLQRQYQRRRCGRDTDL